MLILCLQFSINTAKSEYLKDIDELPYSRKLLREKTFTNFKVMPFREGFLHKILWHAAPTYVWFQSICEFSHWNSHFLWIREVFSLKSLPLCSSWNPMASSTDLTSTILQLSCNNHEWTMMTGDDTVITIIAVASIIRDCSCVATEQLLFLIGNQILNSFNNRLRSN